MNHKQITSLWSTLIIEELVRHGIRRFCISPGSRSTFLTAAAARHPEVLCTIFPDERAAAFFALGYARGEQTPAVLICTSGTAVANYFPAVIEASVDNQPMLILSADRPFELLETGANQTIRQSGIFGSYTRWNFELPEPSGDTPARALLSTIDHAVQRSLGSPPGPVHLNLPFREPLDPVDVPEESIWTQMLDSWRNRQNPLNSFAIARMKTDRTAVNQVREILENASQPLLVAGQLDTPADAEAVFNLAKTLKTPLYADISSQLRMHPENEPLQQLLLSERFTSLFRPDAVLHFGGKLVGKQLAAAIKNWAPEHVIVIKKHSGRYNPDHNVTMSVEAPPGDLANLLTSEISCAHENDLSFGPVCLKTEKELDGYCAPGAPVTEISAARIVSGKIPEGHVAFLANSMPVRDMDTYAALRKNGTAPFCGMNRGVSGIDGNIATAAGFAQGLGKPATLLIGDISFLHDINSLTLLRNMEYPLHIVVINNNGGGIFSFLPIASHKDIFETTFGTPQDYSIRSAAETFGLPYSNPSTNRSFAERYTDMCQSPVSGIIEITSSREENVAEHRRVNARLKAIIDRHL